MPWILGLSYFVWLHFKIVEFQDREKSLEIFNKRRLKKNIKN